LNGTKGLQKEDAGRPGHPVTIKTDENVEKMGILMRTDRRLGTGMIAEVLNMDKDMVRIVITANLNVKKCVPKSSQMVRQFLA